MSDWNTPRPATKAVLSGEHGGSGGSMVGVRAALPDEHPTVTFAGREIGPSGRDRCCIVIDGHRCPHDMGHHGPCLVHVLGETGLTYRVLFGQVNTEADPQPVYDVVAERDRAREIAVALEQQLAAVTDLHQAKRLGDGEAHAVALCAECTQVWPCTTARLFLDDDLPVDSIDLTDEEVTA